MGETRRKFDADFREGAVRLVRETGKPIAQVARDLGINEGTLGNWVNADLKDAGWRVSENTVAKLMAEQHLAALRTASGRRPPVAVARPGHQPVVLVSAEEWQRLEELESAESRAWWRRDAAECAASGEEPEAREAAPGLNEAAFLGISRLPDESSRLSWPCWTIAPVRRSRAVP